MSFYGSPQKFGFVVSSSKGGQVGIYQEDPMQGTSSILLEVDEAEALVKELRRFLDDVASGKVVLGEESYEDEP